MTADYELVPRIATQDLTLLGDDDVAHWRHLRKQFTGFLLQYKFAIDEVLTKVNILRDEFAHLHSENPIEHVKSRLKSPESLLDKIERKGIAPDFDSIRAEITDIAGVRITCSFVSDIEQIYRALLRQDDLTVIQVKDYVHQPKPNGYRSLHMIVSVPVFLSSGTVPVTVEIQIRTIAMDFWASLEHKIYYKYRHDVPEQIERQLHESAQQATALDELMADLHQQVHDLDAAETIDDDLDLFHSHPRDSHAATNTETPGLPLRSHLISRLADLRQRYGRDAT
ncbi:GTP pyrophosphokinase family protein [Pseudoclavibacter sp. CFCC 14310]|uniref:GTP pyrophosphokinase n=1 Tax=Pseudoclavibacter sp. CFCC 14310 TaxID=2615180 RepID=UPI001300ECF2|nr:GTP pyrophosphokinase family protein [Pseudoclavibacter sp. CFCC 14310]KAB1645562.1 GTP pyrophosphokinase family protein [Pseudoclavibacter sp. CFCC 14310]KAB1645979.1 GTP pyrophosphokinase family protein [Pseudoclavibacter sp. CFCC 14310]